MQKIPVVSMIFPASHPLYSICCSAYYAVKSYYESRTELALP